MDVHREAQRYRKRLLQWTAQRMQQPGFFRLSERDSTYVALARARARADEPAPTSAPAPAAAARELPAWLRAHADTAAALRAHARLLPRGLIEREAEGALLVLALACGEHVLLVGPPGTAKSELARRLARAIAPPAPGASAAPSEARVSDEGAAAAAECAYFERQLSRFSLPEELFGPLSLRALDQDRYERQTAGYLPRARVAFLDELFRGSSAILNALLGLMNERLFDNGSGVVGVPLVTLVGASNEWPRSEELEALLDRFLLVRAVRPMSGRGRARALLRGAHARQPAACAAAALELGSVGALREDAHAHVALGERARTLMLELLDDADAAAARARAAAEVGADLGGTGAGAGVGEAEDDGGVLLGEGPPVSDRRLMQTARALRVVAASCGRARVSPWDLLLLPLCWPRVPPLLSQPVAAAAEPAVAGAEGARAASEGAEGAAPCALTAAVLRAAPPQPSPSLEALDLALSGLHDGVFCALCADPNPNPNPNPNAASPNPNHLCAGADGGGAGADDGGAAAALGFEAEAGTLARAAADARARLLRACAEDARHLGAHAWLPGAERRRALGALRGATARAAQRLDAIRADALAMREWARERARAGAWPSAGAAVAMAPALGVRALRERLSADAPTAEKRRAIALMDELGGVTR